MSELQRKVLAPGLPPRPQASMGPGTRPGGMLRKKKDFSPVTWDRYYTDKHDVTVGENVFRVYTRGDSGPVLFFLHGGGFSGLTWALLATEICELLKCRCVAVDLRGHGCSTTTDDSDLSADTLARDVGEIVSAMYGTEPPDIILIGHSMGGAIAVHVAHQNLIPSLIGLAVIDVVEGTAMEALTSMQSFLKSRPSSFHSLEQAIEWSIRSGQIRNLDSAKVSMSGQLKKADGSCASTTVLDQDRAATGTIMEEEDQSDDQGLQGSQHASANGNFKIPDTSSSGKLKCTYTWRIDLSETDRFWEGWFSGLSDKFLSCDVPKMLLLAGVDRLDKQLTIGQMQGKFQMQVLPQCGHAVHEDVPDKVAMVIATFMHRHKFAETTDKFQPIFPAC